MVNLSSKRPTIRDRRGVLKEFANIGQSLQNVPDEAFTDNLEFIEKHDKASKVSSVVQNFGNLSVEDGVLEGSDVKQFKVHAQDPLESGEVAEWIQSVTQEELQTLGVMSNRLFQLLADDQSLEIDAATFYAASTRHDLFTRKQLEILESRRLENVKSLLESDEATKWIRSVREKELQSLGGTSNCLFELLAYDQSLEIDLASLSAASTRRDLFTLKQCEILENGWMDKKDEMAVANDAQDAMEHVAREIKENADD